MKTLYLCPFACLFLLLTACQGTQATEISPGILTSPAMVSPTPFLPSVNALPQEASPEASTSFASQALNGQILHIVAPQDGDVVNTSSVLLRGFALPETVISVNEDIYLVGPQGQFEIPLMLEEGPNVFEIVASDLSGNEESVILVITYQP